MLTAKSSRMHKVNVNLQKTQFVRVLLLHTHDEDRFQFPQIFKLDSGTNTYRKFFKLR